jgi:hypothetical protein
VLHGLKILGGQFAISLVLHCVEAELLAFCDRRQTRTFDGRNVDKHIRAAIVRLNKAEAFGHIKELNSSDGHDDFPFSRSDIRARVTRHDAWKIVNGADIHDTRFFSKINKDNIDNYGKECKKN